MIEEQIDRESITTPRHAGGRPGVDRRGLLAAAARGFVLGAGGLLLPAHLVEEAAADKEPAGHAGAYGGRLGGRRGSNLRGRDVAKRRDRGQNDARRRRNRNGSPRGAIHTRWIKFYVYNDRPVTSPNQSASVRGWANEGGLSDPWERLPVVSLANGAYTGEFELADYQAGAVVIDDRFYVEADNSFFAADVISRLYYGGTMSDTGYDGGTRTLEAEILKPNEQYQATIEGHLFTIKRLYDTDDYKVFDIRFT